MKLIVGILLMGVAGGLVSSVMADPPVTTGLPVQTTGTNVLEGSYTISGSGASLLAGNGGVIAATTALYSGTAGVSGTAGALNGNPWSQNLNGQAFVFEGDSITSNPNGAGQTSYAEMLSSGTGPGTFFNGHGTCYIAAVPGSVIGNGTTAAWGEPQTVTANWSGVTSNIAIVSGSPTTTGGYPIAGPMSVSGPNIPYGTTGTLSMSGTLLTLSQPSTGSSAGNVTVALGGNNCMDRFASQAYPHRPVARGGDGGPRAFYFVMAGANPLAVGESGTNIIQDLLALAATANAAGFTVVVSTILPDVLQNHWSYAQEAQRQIVNQFIRRHGIPGALVIDSCEALSGDPSLFDVNGVHPIGQANAMLANYWNSALLGGCAIYKAQPEYEENDKEFTQWITLDQGIQYAGTAGQTWFSILQPNMAVNSTSAFVFGRDTSGGSYDAGYLSLCLTGTSGAAGNTVSLGLINASRPLTVNGNGTATLGLSTAAAQAINLDCALYVNATNATEAFHMNNPGGSAENFGFALQPNLSSGQATYGYFLGVSESTNNSGGLGFNYVGPGSSSNSIGLGTYGVAHNEFNVFPAGAEVGGYAYNGFTWEIVGTEKVGGNSTIGTAMTITTTGTSGSTGPANTSGPTLWEKVLVNGTTAWRGLYQ